jgi:hypothetical protein
MFEKTPMNKNLAKAALLSYWKRTAGFMLSEQTQAMNRSEV